MTELEPTPEGRLHAAWVILSNVQTYLESSQPVQAMAYHWVKRQVDYWLQHEHKYIQGAAHDSSADQS